MALFSDPTRSIAPAPFAICHVTHIIPIAASRLCYRQPLIAVICQCKQRYYYIQTTSKSLYSLLIRLLLNSKNFEKSIDFVSHDITCRTPIPEPRIVTEVNNICRTIKQFIVRPVVDTLLLYTEHFNCLSSLLVT